MLATDSTSAQSSSPRHSTPKSAPAGRQGSNPQGSRRRLGPRAGDQGAARSSSGRPSGDPSLLASLGNLLPSILAGRARPSDAAETLAFAQLCYDKKLHAASARLWSEAFQSQPKLAGDMQVQNPYNAACAAALTGCGQGKDDPPLDDAAKTRWRKQAMDWLASDLATWSKFLDAGPPQA